MAFNPHEILIFNRGGTRIGSVSKWSIVQPRSYRISEIEDMSLIVPQKDELGQIVLSPAIAALLNRDNLMYIENENAGMPGWGGAISEVTYDEGSAQVNLLSGVSLLQNIETTRIEQSSGTSASIAYRLLSSAQAKQGAHGDALVSFVEDGTTLNLGTFVYEGDIFRGLQALANDTLAEFYVEAVLGVGGNSLSFRLHWNDTFVIDKTGTVTITDGPNGQLMPGSSFKYSGLEPVNRARLRGASTSLSSYLDYSCVSSVINDIAPQVELVLEGSNNFRRREDLNLSVNFGLSENTQRALATNGYDIPDPADATQMIHVKGIQELYLDYYKSFLYAYHNRQGKPFLEGYDWAGPDGNNDTQLTMRYFRTLNKLGRVGAATVVTSGSDSTLAGALIDQWSIDTTISPIPGASIVGAAIDYGTISGHWLANSTNGRLYLLPTDVSDPTAYVYGPAVDWGNVVSGGETLASVATDQSQINTVWVLVSTGGGVKVKAYDIDSKVLLSQYTVAFAANDLAIDYARGRLYLAGTGSSSVEIRDVNNGVILTPDESFAAGSTLTGLSLSGGVVYAANAVGTIRMLKATDGTLLGTFSSGSATDSLLVDVPNRRIWLLGGGASISLYHASIAVGTITGAGSASGAAGFDQILSGQFVHIVMTSDSAYATAPQSVPTAYTTYVVRSGDTLWGIAVKFYGSGAQWPTIYNYNKAVIIATAQAHGFTSDFSHWIFPGEVLKIPGVGGTTVPAVPVAPAVTKYLMTYTSAHWELNTIPAPDPLSPDQLQRTWVTDGDQVVGFTTANLAVVQDPAIVILGEEGRVCDWNPIRDGYGRYKTEQLYRTISGITRYEGAGWYPQSWDVPAQTFELSSDIDWPEGREYLLKYLTKHNREITVQTFKVVNRDNLWSKIERGAIVNLNATLQGPQPGGISLVIRVIAFSPDEYAGYMDIVGEVYA